MAAKKQAELEEKKPDPLFEDRIDEFAIDAFRTLGYTGRLPDPLVATYKAFLSRKSKLQPNYLTAGEYVTVLFLAGMIDKGY